MDIYDYIKSPHKAVEKGYDPCYMTRVSTVINRSVSAEAWSKHIPSLRLDDSVREFFFSLLVIFWMTMVSVTIPVTCWIIAFWMPKSK